MTASYGLAELGMSAIEGDRRSAGGRWALRRVLVRIARAHVTQRRTRASKPPFLQPDGHRVLICAVPCDWLRLAGAGGHLMSRVATIYPMVPTLAYTIG